MADEAVADNGRRDLLKKGAVVGAVAWVAPAIVSVQAASAATFPGRFTLGDATGGASGHDTWLAIIAIDLATSYTNTTGAVVTVTPDVFTFVAGTGDVVLGAEVQPFVVSETTQVVIAIGTTRVGPFTPGTTYTSAFGGGTFDVAPGDTIRLGVRMIGTSGGCPVGFTAEGSTVLTGGPTTADAGSLPGIGLPPTEGSVGWTDAFTPRRYQMRGVFDTI